MTQRKRRKMQKKNFSPDPNEVGYSSETLSTAISSARTSTHEIKEECQYDQQLNFNRDTTSSVPHA